MMPVGKPRRSFLGRTVAVFWCGQCTSERKKNRGRLGHLAQGNAGLVWIYAHATPGVWGHTRRAPAFISLVNPGGRRYTAVTLPASCPRHGDGSVSTADVIDVRANVVLDLDSARV